MASSFSFGQFIVGRLVLGLGVGGVTATVSVWQSEISKAENRGSHVSAFGIFCGMGLTLALFLDVAFSFVKGSVSWRFPLNFFMLPSSIVMAFIFTLPESPRWLIKVNRVEDAREILLLVYSDGQPSDRVEREIRDIQLSIELTGSGSLRSMFSMGRQRIFHRVVLAGLAQVFLQASGISAVTAYASTIYEVNLHFSPTVAMVLAASVQCVVILGSGICSFTVDRFGRRTLMVLSSAGMSICMACITGLASNPNNKTALNAAVAFLFIYNLMYVLGFLGIPFLYASEIAPSHLRSAVCGVSTAISWLTNYLIAEVTPVAFTDISYRYFIVFCIINVVIVPAVYFFFPETSGRELEEIDEIFALSKSIWDPPRVARRLKKMSLSAFLENEQRVEVEQKIAAAQAEPKASHLEKVGDAGKQ
jgi:sugar porter (SP) family MFS transporter